jgi:hypothetical protein
MKGAILALIRPVFVLVVGTIIITAEFIYNTYLDLSHWLYWQRHRR